LIKIKFFCLALLFLSVNSCSMPSIGYFTDVKFEGSFDFACAKKVFEQTFSKQTAVQYRANQFEESLTAETALELKKNFKLSKNLKLTNSVHALVGESGRLRFESFFLASQYSSKMLKKIKKSKDMTNFISHNIYKKLAGLVNRTVQICDIKVVHQQTKCLHYGSSKKYFKCIE